MSAVPSLVWQPTLLTGGTPAADPRFGALTRTMLDERCWIDHGAAWLAGADALFAHLVAHVDWQQYDRPMYGRMVTQPRLTSGWRPAGGDPPPHPVVDVMRELLSHRYGVDFDSVGLNLYRDGQDSVAWHGDRIPRHLVDPLVAIVSVGEPRMFLLRPRGGGRSTALSLGGGDLLVTGGATQRAWQHSVPKVAAAGARISITFRHST